MEILISLGIISFVIVSILSGFFQQRVSTRKTYSKNLAVAMAESRIEELLKFPATQLVAGTTTDYIVPGRFSPTVYTYDPNEVDQMRRTTVLSPAGTLMGIQVTVEYGKKGNTYPFRIIMRTRRGR